MNATRFNRVVSVVKWGSIVFAWCAWVSAIYMGSIALFAVGFAPYLLLYNSLGRGRDDNSPVGGGGTGNGRSPKDCEGGGPYK